MVVKIVSFAVVWCMALLFYVLYRRCREEAEDLRTRLTDKEDELRNVRAMLDIDEKFLNSPDLRFVVTCKECKRLDHHGIQCPILRAMPNQTAKAYCSEGKKVADAVRNVQTTTRP